MRISDWSSDVCSSDLPFAVCPEIGAGQVESKRFGGFAGLLPLRQHAMPSRLWCPDCAFWVGEIGPYSGAADDDPYVSIYDTEKQLLHLGLPSRYQEAMDQGALSDRLLAAFDGLSAQLQAAARFETGERRVGKGWVSTV